ncbi:hypothetical protein PUN28_015677 [Cardiocondyla obscurior]|uniref:Uncharacterized protein n=1 Tax=Cardiocondyla obscurior TaxID=286306 RepID=A0AAW2EWK4_9HYME
MRIRVQDSIRENTSNLNRSGRGPCAASPDPARRRLEFGMNEHSSQVGAKVKKGIDEARAAKGEDELWKNAAKNAPRLDLLMRFPTATVERQLPP